MLFAAQSTRAKLKLLRTLSPLLFLASTAGGHDGSPCRLLSRATQRRHARPVACRVHTHTALGCSAHGPCRLRPMGCSTRKPAGLQPAETALGLKRRHGSLVMPWLTSSSPTSSPRPKHQGLPNREDKLMNGSTCKYPMMTILSGGMPSLTSF